MPYKNEMGGVVPTTEASNLDIDDSDESDPTAYREICDITKTLHGVLHPVTVEASLIAHTKEFIPEAVNGLDYVIEKTHEAANQTLDFVEDSLPVASDLGARAKSLQQRLSEFRANNSGTADLDGLSEDLHQFLGDVGEMSGRLSTNLSGILMAQEFQDLTGQVIRRVMNDVKSVEERLSHIVLGADGTLAEQKTITDSEQVVGLGPVIDEKKETNAVTAQADVDDILSDLDL